MSAAAPPLDEAAETAERAVHEVYLCERLRWLGSGIGGDRRADAFLDPDADDYRYVLSLLIDGRQVPETVSPYPHIPYDGQLVDARPPRCDAVGAFVHAETIHSAASRARFTWNGAIHEAAVVAGHAVLVAWDTPWLSTDRQPKPVALLADVGWVPTVSTVVAATAADFGACYARHHATVDAARNRADDWAASAFYDDPTLFERIAMVNSVIDAPGVSDFALGCLAAGPIEDLIGHDFLDHVMRDGAGRARFIPLLRGTYWHNEPPEIQERMRAILGRGPAEP